ncbi:MAG: TetR/AcrR family transcriptional regulator [Methylocystaceae bacterium]
MSLKPYHHGNLKEALIEAGIELINQEGLDKLSLRKVASICGVSQAAPYSHFQSKDDLLQAMRDYVLAQFMEALEKPISLYGPDEERALIEMGKSYVMFFINNPQYFKFIFSEQCMQVYLSIEMDETDNFPPFKLMKDIAVPILAAKGIAKEKVEDAVISLWATVHGLASIATMKNVHYDKDWGEKVEDIIWNQAGD